MSRVPLRYTLTAAVIVCVFLAIVLDFAWRASRISERTMYVTLGIYWLAVTLLTFPSILRLLVEKTTWDRIKLFCGGCRNLPEHIRNASYVQLLIIGSTLAFFIYTLHLQLQSDPPKWAIIETCFLLLSALGITTVILWALPRMQVSPLRSYTARIEVDKLENEYRRTVAQFLSTLFLVGTLYFTWRQISATEEGKITDRFSQAIQLVASPELPARIGGIYALERISIDSGRDYLSVIEILSTFVQQHAPKNPPTPTPTNGQSPPPAYGHRLADVQAALTVLCRRAKESLYEPHRLFLNRCDLRSCVLVDGKLQRFVLDESDLSDAILIRAHLQGASLDDAVLRRAYLDGAHLGGGESRSCGPVGGRPERVHTRGL
jgi:hypothetical protein